MTITVSKKWIWFLISLVFYIIFIREFLLEYLFQNNWLDWYGNLIESFNLITSINFGFGFHPLEEYQQRTDILLFQFVIILLATVFIRYIYRSKSRCILFTINAILLTFILLVVEEILSTDQMQKKLGSYQYRELNKKINALSKNQQNYYGFRDIERQKKKGDVFRIAVLGDSFIYGDGLANPGDIWSHILEDKFREKYGNSVEVISWGKNGWSTHRELQFLKNQGSEFEIDFLVIGLVSNDPYIPGTSMPRRSFIWQKVVQRAPFFKNTTRLISNQLNRVIMGLPYFKNWGYSGWLRALYKEDNMRAYEGVLIELKKHLEISNTSYLFVFTSTLRDVPNRDYYDPLFAIFERNNIPLLNLYPKVSEAFGDYRSEKIRQELWANPVNSHPGKPLTTLYAESIFRYFEKYELLGKNDLP